MITRFEHFSKEKALEALVWIASEWPGVTQYFVGKTLYFADVAHLNDCGRPILGDEYAAMEYGPVPSFVYDLIKGERIDGHIKKHLNESIESVKNEGTSNIEIKALREPDRDYFSGSDLHFLEKSLNFCKGKSMKELSELTHEHPAWINARKRGGSSKNPSMDYEDMVEKDNPLEDEILHALCNNAHSLLFAA